MDKATRHYRKRQIECIRFPESDYFPIIQIRNNDKETNFITISFEELDKIKDILTKGE